jgi:AcrR family transcriptional regulator
MAIDTPGSELSIDPVGRHGGRHLDSSRDDVLRAAALQLLAEIGYDRLTVEGIATCAGAGKATIYRRWSGKAELVVDALMCQKPIFSAPDTGTLRGDLEALSQRVKNVDRPLDTEVMIGLVSALPHDAELREAFNEQLIAPHLATFSNTEGKHLGLALARDLGRPADDHPRRHHRQRGTPHHSQRPALFDGQPRMAHHRLLPDLRWAVALRWPHR